MPSVGRGTRTAKSRNRICCISLQKTEKNEPFFRCPLKKSETLEMKAVRCAPVVVVMIVMAMVVSFSGSSSNKPSVLAVFRPKLPVLKQRGEFHTNKVTHTYIRCFRPPLGLARMLVAAIFAHLPTRLLLCSLLDLPRVERGRVSGRGSCLA